MTPDDMKSDGGVVSAIMLLISSQAYFIQTLHDYLEP